MNRLGIAALLCMWAAVLIGQTPQTAFRTGVEVVELDVSVTRGGRPVAGLQATDFAVADNGVMQDVQSVTLDRLPLSVVLTLDTSSSVSGDRLAHLVQAGQGLVSALRDGERAALVTFSHQVQLRVPMTGATGTIAPALAGLKGSGGTALRDAVYIALETRARDHTRPLVLVFTDGEDTASWLTEDAALETAKRAGVVVHAVTVGADAFLTRLVDACGGRTWSATSDRQLQELFTKALEEMRARYLLSYSPAGIKGPGWHELRVRLRNGRADITARPGYYVP